MLVSQVMVTDTVQWFWDPAIEWSECLHVKHVRMVIVYTTVSMSTSIYTCRFGTSHSMICSLL